MGNRDNLEITSHVSHKNRFCDPSLELSRQDGSNEGSQHMILLRNKKNYLLNSGHTPSYLELCTF